MNINIPRSSEKEGKGDICIVYVFIYDYAHICAHKDFSKK